MYSATDKRTGRKVAIKQMVVAKQVKKEIIINEIMIMKQSTHSAIVNFVDAFLVDGILWVSLPHHRTRTRTHDTRTRARVWFERC